jgi:hypothetical protein
MDRGWHDNWENPGKLATYRNPINSLSAIGLANSTLK